jgi:hypothetical protein
MHRFEDVRLLSFQLSHSAQVRSVTISMILSGYHMFAYRKSLLRGLILRSSLACSAQGGEFIALCWELSVINSPHVLHQRQVAFLFSWK